MDYVNTIENLKTKANFFEVYHRDTFKCYRNKKSGGVQEVIVEVLDAGPQQSARYSVVATAGDKGASGNPGSTVEEALAFVHWWTLDSE